DVARVPYDRYFGDGVDSADLLDRLLADPSSGVDAPAAIIVELVQGEGGLNVASAGWMRRIAATARAHGALLIVDDIQAGCGRTGTFFSFEGMGVEPDIITLAKSLSGFGLPMAVTLMKPEIDRWKPGEHNGTFRGNAHAFVTATAALGHYWKDAQFTESVRKKSRLLRNRLQKIASRFPSVLSVKGRGMMQGLSCKTGVLAKQISQ